MFTQFNVFDIRENIVHDYAEYIRGFLNIDDDNAKNFIEEVLEKGEFWPDPLIQLNPSYEKGASIKELVNEKLLMDECLNIFQKDGAYFTLYKHQEEAIRKILSGKSIIVSTGTGSGKSLIYLIPIINHILKHRPQRTTVAILVFPMNALVNSQLENIRKLLKNLPPEKRGIVTVRQFTGQLSKEEKKKIRNNPPHIILTNYVMLEYMMTRKEDDVFFRKPMNGKGLSYIVVDEIHNYKGRLGADVALLVRRIKERIENNELIFIGTSATLAGKGTTLERRREIAKFATKFFGVQFNEDQVIEERIQPLFVNNNGHKVPELIRCLQSNTVPQTYDEFINDPLAHWIESFLGYEKEESGFLRRSTPKTLHDVAKALSDLTNVDESICATRIKEYLLAGASIFTPENLPIFALKLHQFLTQGSRLYATLEPRDGRRYTFQGQMFWSSDKNKRLYPIAFCRMCGYEYYEVRFDESEQTFKPREYSIEKPSDDDVFDESIQFDGYLTPVFPDDAYQGTHHLPDTWLTPNGRPKKDKRARIPQQFFVKLDGKRRESPSSDTGTFWFIPGPLAFCIHCGEIYTGRSEYAKLATLATGGRCSATTVLCLSAVQRIRSINTDKSLQKVLSFSDNRQDASLQAGHFNDFIRVVRLRSAFYHALKKHHKLDFSNVVEEVFNEMKVELSEISKQGNLDPHSPQARRTLEIFKELLEYRIYEELQRGWRITHPNLEQVGLLEIDFHDIEYCAQNGDVWREYGSFLSLEARKVIVKTLLNEMTHQLAVDADILKKHKQDALKKACEEYLNEKWSFEKKESLRTAVTYIPPSMEHHASRLPHIRKLNEQTLFGRWLRKFWAEQTKTQLDIATYRVFIESLLEDLVKFGIVTPVVLNKNVKGFRVKQSALIWKKGSGNPYQDILRLKRLRTQKKRIQPVNTYFVSLYTNSPELYRDVHSAEHTAQINYADRMIREEDFREGFLSVLFCSPTMELGIDISDLNVVHLRNVPPSPPRYAQRSGRAGRGGWPALILTYCGHQSSHDQYFFRHPEEMVAGSVKTPFLDLTSEELIRSHLHAVWLSFARAGEFHSMRDILDLEIESLPLKENVKESLKLNDSELKRCAEYFRRILESCNITPETCPWFSEEWIHTVLNHALDEFDRAFDRWREMYRAAQELEKHATELKQKYRLTGDRQIEREARFLESESDRQMKLLLGDVPFDEHDFYPYRYLATEGFLPGYSFPILPLRAYIPSTETGEIIQRERFIGITEFGPRNFIYHNGSKYQIVGVNLKADDLMRKLTRGKVCSTCGYIHAKNDFHVDVCLNCSAVLSNNNETMTKLLEIHSVRTERREKITSEEEYRMRLGYETPIYFSFPDVQNKHEYIKSYEIRTAEHDTLLTNMKYIENATVWVVNKKWVSAREEGYRMNLRTGMWEKSSSQTKNEVESEQIGPVKIVYPFVQETHHAIVWTIPQEYIHDEVFKKTFMYAILEGLRKTFELDRQELSGILLGELESFLFIYESSGESLGVLRRFANEKERFHEVIRQTLSVIHIDPDSFQEQKPAFGEQACLQACYECLLSFYNQREHDVLNRHRIIGYLKDLLSARVLPK